MRVATSGPKFLNSKRFASRYRGTDPAIDGEDIFQDAAVSFLSHDDQRDVLVDAMGTGPDAEDARAAVRRKFASRGGTSHKRERGRGLALPLEETLVACDDPAPDETSEADELEVHLREALEHLPRARREALVLHCLRGLSVREVADTLEIPEGTVRTNLYRGKRQLRRELVGTA